MLSIIQQITAEEKKTLDTHGVEGGVHVFSLKTEVYEVILSLQDNACASAHHNIFRTDFKQRLWKRMR